MDQWIPATIVFAYIGAMIGIGFVGRKRATSESEFLVAGRRLGPMLYVGTMSALVLGGASTVGGVGLGFEYGISGMWLVVTIGLGICVLSLFFAGRIQRARVYTVSGLLELRYGPGTRTISAIIMMFYAVFLAVTSTVAYGTIFAALFDLERYWAVLLGGSVVIIYSLLGGMWSITLTDFVQFLIQTLGIFFLLLPITLSAAGGLSGMREALPASYFDFGAIGGQSILTYVVVYGFGLLIGQDIWQRVFTARSAGVARWGGLAAGIYCLAYGAAGALVGMAAKVLMPDFANENRDDVFGALVSSSLTPVVAGLVLAAALAAVMSTSSGSLIAAATVANKDLFGRWFAARRTAGADAGSGAATPVTPAPESVGGNRWYIVIFGVLVLGLSLLINNVVEALTIAYNILVGGLLVAILGALVFKRGTARGAVASMSAGGLVTIGTMLFQRDLLANEPIYFGLAASLIAYIVVSLLTEPTDKRIQREWTERTRAGR